MIRRVKKALTIKFQNVKAEHFCEAQWQAKKRRHGLSVLSQEEKLVFPTLGNCDLCISDLQLVEKVILLCKSQMSLRSNHICKNLMTI